MCANVSNTFTCFIAPAPNALRMLVGRIKS